MGKTSGKQPFHVARAKVEHFTVSGMLPGSFRKGMQGFQYVAYRYRLGEDYEVLCYAERPQSHEPADLALWPYIS